MGRSVISLRSYAVLVAFFALIAFLPAVSVRAASDDSEKAAALRNLSLQLIDVSAEQLRRGAYSAAQTSLEQANENRQYLSVSEQKKLDDLMAKAKAANVEREKIYEKMQAAQASAKSNDYGSAISSLSSIQDSPYLTAVEKKQIHADIDTYKSESQKQQGVMAVLFARSINLYNDGKLEDARKGFEEVASSGAPLVSEGPSAKEYIAKIDKQLTAAASPSQPPVSAETKPPAAEEELLAVQKPAAAAGEANAPAVSTQAQQPKQPEMQQPVQPSAEPNNASAAVQAPEAKQPAEVTTPAPAAAAPAAKELAQCAPSEGSYIDKVMQQRNVQRSYAEAVVDDAMSKARAQISQGNFAAARDSISSARRTVDNNKMLLGDEMYKQMSDTLNAIMAEIDAKSTASAAVRQQEKERQAVALQQQLRSQQETERRQRIDDLMNKALALQREQRYEDARGQLELLLAIDPLNEQALAMHQTLTDMINYRKQLEVRNEINDQTLETYLNSDKSSIPHAEEVTYPKDWREIVSKRAPEELAGMNAADIQVNKELDETVDLSKLTADMPLSDAIEILSNSVQPPLHIIVIWSDLESNADITRNTHINMEPVTGITLRKALETLLSSVASGGVQLAYVVDSGSITIATKNSSLLPNPMFYRVYSITNFLIPKASYDTSLSTSNFGQIQQVATIGGTGGSAGGGGQQQQQQSTQQQTTAAKATQIQDILNQLILQIKAIDSDTWSDAGGTGSVAASVDKKSLVVYQTSKVHQDIEDFLKRQRKALALDEQVSIEARFITVSEQFLEDIGFNMNLTLTNWGGKFDPLVLTQNSISTTSGGEKNVALTATTAYGTVLDNLQASFLINATQQNSDSHQLQAPRVAVTNTGTATFTVTTEHTYLSNVTSTQSATGNGSSTSTVFNTLQNDISSITDGVVLKISPTISDDKKYVILDISARSGLADLSQTFATPVQVGSTSATENIAVTIPTMTTQEVETQVNVPDKGTLLMGGQKVTTESEVEVGVPVLGKLPIIGRLFSNRSSQRQQQVLLILVTPTIVLNDEREAEAVANLQPPGK